MAFPKDGIVINSKQDWKITFNDDGIKIEAKGNTIIMGEDGVLINGCLVNKEGDVITKKGVNLDTHTHNQGDDSHGDSEVPTDPPNVG